jgi:hypothetical protein
MAPRYRPAAKEHGIAAHCGNSDQAVGRNTSGTTPNGSGIQPVLQVIRIVLDPRTTLPISATRQPTLIPNGIRCRRARLEPVNEIIVDVLPYYHTGTGGSADTDE